MENELKIYLDNIIQLYFIGYDDDVIKSYKTFKIELSKKSTKINESYDERKMTIYNLFRNEVEIVNSLIICLAHHIDFCRKGFTNNKLDFFNLYKEILTFSLDNGFLSFESLVESDDYKSIKRIRNALESYWNRKVKTDVLKIEVYNCYSSKQFLKEKDYRYSYLGRCWYKIIENTSFEEESISLKKHDCNMKVYIENENKITINIKAKICVSGKTYFIKNVLKEEHYRFEDRIWKKIINASSYIEEKNNIIKKLPEGQGINVYIEYC